MGEGSFDFKTLFSAVKDNNCIHTIEAHSPEDVLKSLNKFKEYHKSYLSKTRTSEQGI
jgi:sugar phosphate isomerase/epimerase